MRKRRDWLFAATVVLVGELMAQAEAPLPGQAPLPLSVSQSISQEPPSPAPGLRAATRGKAVYASAFDKEAGEQWSAKQVTKCPSGRRTFLGPFAYECTTLSLTNLPKHARVRLSFDLMIMLSWDGDKDLDQPNPTAPDLFDVTVDRGPRLVHASFVAWPESNSHTQSFPGRFPYDHLPPGTAAVESRSLGCIFSGVPDDYVYHIERSFAHSGKSLKIAFSGINLEAVDNECWGLDNVRVEVLPAVKADTLNEAAFAQFWADLESADPKKFVPAIDAMIDLGEPGVAAIRKRLEPPSTGADQNNRIGKLIAQLDADNYMVREKATAALRELGAAAEPALRAARANAASLEARTRIDKLLCGLKVVEPECRLRRIVEVLELIGGDQARAVMSDIAGRTGTLPAREAKAAIQRLEGKAEIPTKLDLPPRFP